MSNKLIVNVSDFETRVALLEDETLAELFIERGDDSDIAGNIYKGKVQRVLPGMQAAFIDIGLNQAAFIHVNDVLDHNESKLWVPELWDPEDVPEESDSHCATEMPPQPNPPSPIEDLLMEGQQVLVQVAKAPIGTKGSRVTMYVALPGRYLVLMPTSQHVGISRRIESEQERKRLREIIFDLRQSSMGYIVRTAAEGIKAEKLAAEMTFLNDLWQTIQRKYQLAPTPSLLHKELSISLKAVRDLLIDEAEKLIIDSKEGYSSILSFLDTFNPRLKDSVELYHGLEPIFDAYNIEGDISRALKRKVWLKSGGYIVIEFTEALVAIDVNTGRYVGTHNLEETIVKTNLEAVKEIAYQIRLRDIGGIIIIDFIDMEKKSNQEKVFNALKEALKKDRSKTHVLPMSEMGLIQMTRKRVKKSLHSMLCEPCFYCDGEAYLKSGKTICYAIYRDIVRDSKDMQGSQIALHVNPKIAELLHGEERQLIICLETMVKKHIIIYPNAQYHVEQYEIVEVRSDARA